jgi:hypothetical protein
MQRVEAFTRTMVERQRADQLLRSEQGVKLVLESIENIWNTIQTALPTDPDSPAPVKFRCKKAAMETMYVSTVHGMHLGLHATNVHLNSVSNTRLEAKIFQRYFELGEPPSNLLTITRPILNRLCARTMRFFGLLTTNCIGLRNSPVI